ncbi:MAG: Flp pilus assembly protein CpaB [Pseudomonadota bacterium]
MKSRDIAVFAVALVLAVGVAFVTRMVIQTKRSEAVVVQGAKAPTARVLVAEANLPVGSTLTKQKAKWQDWPEDSVDGHYVTPSKIKKKTLYGSIVRYPITKGEPIKTANLLMKGDKSILSAIVRPGMRAFTIALDRKTNISGWIAPRDLVDVIVAARQGGSNRAFLGKTVVSKVPVLAVDSALQADDDKRGDKPPQTITLEVTPDQAERLAAAIEEGKPVISLHSFADHNRRAVASRRPQSKGSRAVTMIRGSEEMETVNVRGE